MDLINAGLMSNNTVYAFRDDRPVNTKSIDILCEYLQCQPGDLMTYVDTKTQQEIDELEAKIQIYQAELAQKIEKLKKNKEGGCYYEKI